MNNDEVEKNHRSRGGSGWKIWRRKKWEEEGEQEEEVETDLEDGRRREVAGS